MARPTPQQMRSIRTNSMFTMREVADQTGLALNTVWNAENSKRKSRITTLHRLLKFYELQRGRNQATSDLVESLGGEPLDAPQASRTTQPISKPNGASIAR